MDRPSMQLETMRRRLASGEVSGARKDICVLLDTTPVPADDHYAWAELCEEAGLTELAMRQYEAALDIDPKNRDVLAKLLDLYAERGERERGFELLCFAFREDESSPEFLERLVAELRARSMYRRIETCLERALNAGQDENFVADLRRGAFPNQTHQSTTILPEDADVVRFLELFSGRGDVHARQWFDEDRGCGYSPVRQPIDPQLLRNHLLGNVTLGVYPLQLDMKVRFMAIDIDMSRSMLEQVRSEPKAAAHLRSDLDSFSQTCAAKLRSLGFDPLLEDSGGRGRHLWCTFSEAVEARDVVAFGKRFMAGLQKAGSAKGLSLEFFPKQSRLRGKGLGNLIKLPLGVHQGTGRRSCLLGEEGEVLTEPWVRLRAWGRGTATTLLRGLDLLEPAESKVESLPDDTQVIDIPMPPVQPAAPSVAWTSGHFESDTQISCVLNHCSVLKGLVQKSCEGEDLNYDERTTLRHTLGHLPNGVVAVNWLLSRCPQTTDDQPLVHMLRGSPCSCAKMRKRHTTDPKKEGCDCKFPEATDTYPNPLLHLRSLEAPEEKDDSSEELAKAYGALLRIEKRAGAEKSRIEEVLVGLLKKLPEAKIEVKGGSWVLFEEGGVQELRFVPESSE